MNNDYTNMTTSQIQMLSDIELKKVYMSLRSRIIISHKDMVDSKDLEIIFCYITRELEMRS